MAAHFLSLNFEREFSVGHLLSSFMEVLHGDSLIKGFSANEEEFCHETVHGEGTCGFFEHRDGVCEISNKGLDGFQTIVRSSREREWENQGCWFPK